MLMSRFSRVVFIASLSLVVMLVAGNTALAQPMTAGHKVASLEIKILSTMLADQGFGEWGFAALVEVDGRKILFDTGAHCTGIESAYRIRDLVGLTRQTCMVGAVGASYSLAKGISAGRIAK